MKFCAPSMQRITEKKKHVSVGKSVGGRQKALHEDVLGLFSNVSCSWPGKFPPALVEEELWCGGDLKGSLECNLPEPLC